MFKNNRERHLDEISEHFRLEHDEDTGHRTETLPKECSAKEFSAKEVTFNLNHSADQEKKTK